MEKDDVVAVVDYESIRFEIFNGLKKVYDGSIADALRLQNEIPQEAELGFTDEFKFRIINIMSKCRLICTNASQECNIQLLANEEENMFYVKKGLPSLLLNSSEISPTVLFSKNGFVTMVGGSSLYEIQYAMSIYCYKLLFFLKLIYPNRIYKIDQFKICNKVCSTRLKDSRISIAKASENAKMSGYRVKYNRDSINILYVYPGKPFHEKLSISFANNGGIQILGFRHSYQIKLIKPILVRCLRGCLIRYDSSSEPTYEQKSSKYLAKKTKKKLKNIKKWKQRMQNDTPSLS